MSTLNEQTMISQKLDMQTDYSIRKQEWLILGKE